jgi:hypothetical protein
MLRKRNNFAKQLQFVALSSNGCARCIIITANAAPHRLINSRADEPSTNAEMDLCGLMTRHFDGPIIDALQDVIENKGG